jgi:hypothetical protein
MTRRTDGCKSVIWGLAVLAMLAGLGCGTSSNEPPASLNYAPISRKAFAASLEATAQGIGQYALENGQVPQGEGVQVLYQEGIRGAPSKDPWDGEVRYYGEGNRFTLSSAGPDRQWETKDDIVIQR